MKRILYPTVVLLFISHWVYAQSKRAHQWVLGHGTTADGMQDGILFDFNGDTLRVEYFQKQLFMNGCNTSICDTNGDLLFYSNGCSISNLNNEILNNNSPGRN